MQCCISELQPQRSPAFYGYDYLLFYVHEYLLACVYVLTARMPSTLREHIGSPGTAVTDGR